MDTSEMRRSGSFTRTSPRWKYHSHGSSAIAVDDAIHATEIQLESRPSASVPQQPTPEMPLQTFMLPVPSSPKVGPDNFEKIRILGAGSTGRVYLVRSVGLGDEEYYAMKVVKKSELVKRNRVQRVLTERQILSVANHPFVVTLHYSFQTAEFFYLVMQYCAGGELFSFLRSQQNHRLCEADARFYAAEVLIALEYLHMLGIIYRDLKPENILVHESGHVMLSDFDLAHEVKHAAAVDSFSSSSSPKKNSRDLRSDSLNHPKPMLMLMPLSPNISTTDSNLWFKMREQHQMNHNVVTMSRAPGASSSHSARSTRRRRFSCPCVCMPPMPYPHIDTESHLDMGEKRTSFVGTHEYVAPEIISEEGYVGSVDWWAFGVLLYEMIFGRTPFRGSTQIETLENILDICGEVEFPAEIPVSDDCKDLIQKLLAKSVDKRILNPLVIKSHPFFKDLIWPLIRHQQPPIIPPMVHSLREKVFSIEEMSEFDDEVPFHRALSFHSPRRRSRRCSHSSVSSNGSTIQLASIAQSSYDSERGGSCASIGTVNGLAEKEHEPPETPRGSPCSRASIVERPASLPRSPSFRLESSTVSSPPPSPSSRLHTSPPKSRACSPPASPTSAAATPAAADSPNMTAGVVHDFEFVSSQRRSFWSSRASHHSLTAKMSQLDIAAQALDGLRPEEVDNEDEDDDDNEEATTIDLRGSITGGLNIY